MPRYFSSNHYISMLFSLSLLVITSCGTEKTGFSPESKPQVRAAETIGDSFVVTKDGDPKVTILKSALEKEFLLQAALIPQEIVAMGQGLKSRIVTFKRQGKQIFLLEATKGHTVTNDLPQELILTVFPIEEETATEITLDFTEGMSRIFVAGDWAAQDFSGRQYQSTTSGVEVINSRLASVKADSQNRLAIRQIAQVSVSGFQGEDFPTLEVRYFLSPYRPDLTYVPVESKDFKRMGFFEVAPLLNLDGSTTVWATKFHNRKPIVFAISANTPPEFKQAVRDGILYWNQAFPEAVVQAVEAPAGVTAPDANYNVVQWVPWDQAGYAYADAQMDPRTGEILHAQVYLTSAFAFSGKARARKILTTIKTAGKLPLSRKQYSLMGFNGTPHCSYNSSKELSHSLSNLLASGPSEEQVLKVAQDYVRAVVAHEIGHTLGLRHNFAGSLHTEHYPLEHRDEIFKKYLAAGEVASEVVPGSSVMEYPQFEEDVLVGARIAGKRPMLPYDSKAIATLYQGTEFKAEEIPPFCTDSQLSRYVDCKPFDSGSSLVEFSTFATQQNLKDLAHDLVETYIAAKSPPAGKIPLRVEEVGLDPEEIAGELLDPRTVLLGSMGSDNRVLKVLPQFPYVSAVNIDDVREKEREYFLDEIGKIGGADKVFSTIPSDLAESTVKAFEVLIQSESHKSGVGPGGKHYEFSNAEIENMVANVGALMKKVPSALAKRDLDLMGRIPTAWKVTGNKLGDEVVTLLSKRIEQYVFTQGTEKITAEIEIKMPEDLSDRAKTADAVAAPEPAPARTKKLVVTLPEFAYPLNVRKAAAPVLKPGSEPQNLGWALHERAHYKAEFIRVLSEAIGCKDDKRCSFDKIKPEDVTVTAPADMAEGDLLKLKKSVTRWFLENKQVLGEFSS